jgi:probable HAF family extracellular repeat protein
MDDGPRSGGRRITRRTVITAVAAGAAALAAPQARAAAGPPAPRRPVRAGSARPRHTITSRLLCDDDGSHPLVQIRDVNRQGHVLGMVDLGEGAAIRWPSAIWADGRVTVLPAPLAGAVDTGAVRLNDRDQAVGYCTVAGNQSAVLWTGGVPRVLDIGTVEADATALNDLGQVVVHGWNVKSGETATWNTVCLVDGESVTAVAPPATTGGMILVGRAVDEQGAIAIEASRPQSADRTGFVWRDGAVVADFTDLDGSASFAGFEGIGGMNARGQVVGDYYALYAPRPGAHTFLWSAGTVTDVAGLGDGNSTVVTFGRRPVNDLGDVVGVSDLGSGVRHTFLWSGGRTTDLGTLGGPTAYPVGVNNRREVAGNSTLPDGSSRAFLWRAGELIAITPPAGYADTAAEAVTEQGEVVGRATSADGSLSTYMRWTVG